MRILVLGGTAFVGRHIVEAALADGHAVTLLTRGQTNPGLFPEAEHVHADRSVDLSPLAGRQFDAVVDTSAYLPEDVRRSTSLLAGAAGRYLFISTGSVYAPTMAPRVGEDAAVHTMPDDAPEELSGETYGPLKVRCEEIVKAAFGPRATIVRPGLVVGPEDRTNRFGYWVERLARGGDVLAPGEPGRQVQVIDARDLAAFVLRLLVDDVGGTFNGYGPPVSMQELLEACARAAGSDARLVWVPEAELLEAGVAPWQELPVWFPDEPDGHPLFAGDDTRARTAGLVTRPLEETARDTLAFIRRDPEAARAGSGMAADTDRLTPEREAELLAAHLARSA